MKKKANKEIYHHFAKLKKLLDARLIYEPDKVYPEISEHLKRICFAIRKLSISMTLLNNFIRDGLRTAQENYKKSPNDYLKSLILEIEHDIYPAFQEYYMFTQNFREHIPIKISEEVEVAQVFPSRQIRHFLDELKKLEEYEHEMSKRFNHFFARHKQDIKELFGVVNTVERG
ncbi:MAG: hypothetical protein ABIA62_00310 [Candidatus Woesearchaeota archaeon]